MIHFRFDTNHEGRPNDIAIILIKGEFTFSDIIKPICLERLFNGPIEEPEIGEMGYVSENKQYIFINL